jgi:hypothetical protein
MILDLQGARGEGRQSFEFGTNEKLVFNSVNVTICTVDFKTHNLSLSRQSWVERLEKQSRLATNVLKNNAHVVITILKSTIPRPSCPILEAANF